MLLDPPTDVSQDHITLDVREIEPLLQGPAMAFAPWPGAMIELKDGRTMYIREATLEEAPELMRYMRRVMETEHDFYDVVGARVHAELAGWYRKRLKDPYTLVGLIDGEWVGFCNGRLMNEDINISLHSMAFKRGLRAGAIMYYAKCEYCFEHLGQEEFWATYESYNGLKRWGIGMAQPSYPWPNIQHELGGAKVFYVTKNYWDTSIKKYLEQMIGTKLERPVPAKLLKANEKLVLPTKLEED
jgi:hypothetical protein